MVLANLLQSLSGTANNIFVGQLLGTQALAAVAGMFPILFFFIALIIGIGAGASVLIGQAWGARETGKVKAIAGAALCLSLLIGLAVGVFGGLYTEPLLRILGTPDDVLPLALGYARPVLLAMPVLLVFILYTQLLRGVGDTVTPLYALLLSTVVSCLLTPAFILGWLGLPRLGVASAAVAAIVSFVVSLVYLVWHLHRRRHPLALDARLLRALRPDGHWLRLVLRLGLPTSVQMIMIALSEIAVLSLVNGFGSGATAAYGAVNQVVNYVQFPALSIAITASILGAQAIGAGQPGRLNAIMRTGLALNLLITGSLVLLGYLASRPLMRMFISDANVAGMAQSLLHIMLWSCLVFGFAAVLGGVMRASGTVLVPTAIAIVCIAFIQVPSAWLLSRQIGIDGVWMAYPIAFCAMLLMQGAYYGLVWRKRKIHRLV
ncbi:multidrug transporter MatE [Hylemonella gracilis str. Niagara R]|uniref:Multidrug transporter MatE n=2 Tax=Hylemonella gracilis TaxID=80880 RepID=A0A016XE27_9BURK|nr:MATE family efflux transporter [Hylemonella gracilis]EYC49842.1 multidrug transporter MatE [Hylemonella gracilis str. Niagara R]